MIIAATGHRPQSLGGYGNGVRLRLAELASSHLSVLAPDIVISGMALGWDMAVAEAALDLAIPLYAFVPGMWQPDNWPRESQVRWRNILDLADGVKVCTPAIHYDAQAMQIRNMKMVDECNVLLALWNGQPGGTANCLSYARQRPNTCTIINLWSQWEQGTRP